VFQFSSRPGTAAAAMNRKVSSGLSADRSRRLIKAGEESARIFHESMAGRILTVIPEKYDETTGCIEGLSENNLRVYWKGSEEDIGRFVKVLIVGLNQTGLIGRNVTDVADNDPNVVAH
jgi:threonylcarbamoyladenosine tRNA methylthiotransferase MtaB